MQIEEVLMEKELQADMLHEIGNSVRDCKSYFTATEAKSCKCKEYPFKGLPEIY
jgi:hypothetical protein